MTISMSDYDEGRWEKTPGILRWLGRPAWRRYRTSYCRNRFSLWQYADKPD